MAESALKSILRRVPAVAAAATALLPAVSLCVTPVDLHKRVLVALDCGPGQYMDQTTGECVSSVILNDPDATPVLEGEDPAAFGVPTPSEIPDCTANTTQGHGQGTSEDNDPFGLC